MKAAPSYSTQGGGEGRARQWSELSRNVYLAVSWSSQMLAGWRTARDVLQSRSCCFPERKLCASTIKFSDDCCLVTSSIFSRQKTGVICNVFIALGHCMKWYYKTFLWHSWDRVLLYLPFKLLREFFRLPLLFLYIFLSAMSPLDKGLERRPLIPSDGNSVDIYCDLNKSKHLWLNQH